MVDSDSSNNIHNVHALFCLQQSYLDLESHMQETK